MSTNTIKTRIKLRVDTAANWATNGTGSNAIKIYKGEAALSLGEGNKYEIRIGTSDSGSTWAELAASNLTVLASNVIGLADSLYDYQLTTVAASDQNYGSVKLQKKLHSAEDTAANWTDVTELKVTGTYSATNPFVLKDYVDNAVSNATTAYYEGIRADGETDQEVIARVLGAISPTPVLKGGSTFVIKTPIANTSPLKYEYIAFTYDTTSAGDPTWRAMDGNYNAESVYFDENIMVTTQIGLITSLTNGQATWNTQGKNLLQALQTLVAQEKYATKTNPSATVSLTNSNTDYVYKDGNNLMYEYGTTVTPAWKTTFSAGSYTYGPATGVTSTSSTVYHGTTADSDADSVSAGNLNNATGTFDDIVVTSSTDYQAKLQWGSTASSATPITNLGNDSTVTQSGATGSVITKIAALTNQTATSAQHIKGFANGIYYGTVSTAKNSSTIDSAVIKSLTANKRSTTTGTFTFNVPTGAATVIIAAKGTRSLSNVTNTTVNADMTGTFNANKINSVTVAGADNSTTSGNQSTYTVWYYTPTNPYSSPADLSVTIA